MNYNDFFMLCIAIVAILKRDNPLSYVVMVSAIVYALARFFGW